MTDVKKFVFKFGLYLLCIVVILYLFGRLERLRIKNNNPTVYAFQNSKNYDSLDFLVLGNSYAYSDISCFPFDSLGLRYYNLGAPVASSYYYEVALNDYFNHTHKRPRYILMMVSPIMFSDASDNWESYTIHRSALIEPLSNESVFLKYDIGLKRYLMLVVKSAKTGIENTAYWLRGKQFYPKDDFKETRGYVIREGELAAEDTLKSKEPWTSMCNYHFRKDKFIYMLNLVHKLKEQKIQVVFYEPPTFHTEKFFSKEFIADYENALKLIEDEHDILIRKNNFEDLVFLKNYRDIDHMNGEGAKLYTQRMIKTLTEKNIIQ